MLNKYVVINLLCIDYKITKGESFRSSNLVNYFCEVVAYTC